MTKEGTVAKLTQRSSPMLTRGKKFFITGGAGFIATHLIKRLLPDHHIIIYDNLSRNSLKRSGLWDHPNLECVQGDVVDYEFLNKSIPRDTDMIVHMAAGAVILPGAKIGEGAIIGAGAVVVSEIPSYEVWTGVPAQKINER